MTEIVLTGNDLKKFVDADKAKQILKIFEGELPIKELLTLSSILASAVVAVCESSEQAVKTIEELSSLQTQIAQQLFDTGIVAAAKAGQSVS